MINDNYVTGDNIYLRELQNFFFEVLGMMSITHYGAIGNGRVDNYGPIQVAIDDALRRGISFLYVPYGRFIYTGEFQNLIDEETGKEKIIFMGNPHSHIVNIRTGEEIEIHQFGWFWKDGENYYSKDESDGRFVNKAGDTMTGTLEIDSADLKVFGEISQGASNATQVFSTALGISSKATGWGTLSEGAFTEAKGAASHAEGRETIARGTNSHAEGYSATASGAQSHAEGKGTTASGFSSHAEGGNTTASGQESHAEGWNSEATFNSAHAEGTGTKSVSQSSHSEGYGTIARGLAQHVEGEYNIEDTTAPAQSGTKGAYLHIVGNGNSNDARSNAHTIDWDGNAWFSGNVYTGSTSGTNKDSGSKRLITEDEVRTLLQNFAQANNLNMPS